MSLARLAHAVTGAPRRQALLALLSGLLAALALAPFQVPGLVLVALVPLFVSLRLATSEASFVKRGLLFGLGFYGLTLCWLLSLIEFSWLAVPAGAFVIVSHMIQVFLALVVVRLGWWLGWRTLAVAPCAFVVAENLRSYGDLAVPWASLGYGLGRPVYLAQIAAVVGIWGLTAWAVAVNAALADLIERRTLGRGLLVAAVVLPALAYDAWRMAQPEPAKHIRVGVLQPNVAQEEKWDENLVQDRMTTLDQLTQKAVTQGAEMVVWPEVALPWTIDLNNARWKHISREAPHGSRALVVGAATGEGAGDGWIYALNYNSTILYDGAGEAQAIYHKRRLVPVTEAMPFASLLGFAASYIPREYAKIAAGHEVGVLRAKAIPPLGAIICFESVFPDLARDLRRDGAEILVNLTNDAWFGRSFAPYQHAVFPTIRAIEERMPVARAANTGVSSLIDTHGRELARSAIFRDGVLVAELHYGAKTTFYTRHGPLVLPLSFAVVALTLGAALWRSSHRPPT